MCRLAFIPGQVKATKGQLLGLLDMLEFSCGGDGNGYLLVSPNGAEEVFNKGVKLDNKAILNDAYKLIRRGWSMYYHTRKISVGWADDAQCHPFKVKGPKYDGYLCHNGTWYDGAVMAKYFKCGSDTSALAKLLGKFDINDLQHRELFPKGGVFLLYGARPGHTPVHRVIKLSGDLQYCTKSRIWASQFDKSWVYYGQEYNVEDGSHMLEKPAPKSTYIAPVRYVATKFSTSKRKAVQAKSFSDKTSPMWLRDSYYLQDFDEVDKVTDSTFVDRNLLS